MIAPPSALTWIPVAGTTACANACIGATVSDKTNVTNVQHDFDSTIATS
jgi:hypothetical protein